MKKVTEKEVQEVMDFTLRMKEIRYIPKRKTAFAEQVSDMSDTTKWLLAFCCWQCLFNTRYRGFSEERVVGVPTAQVNEATFDTFINYLRSHENKTITPSREVPTIKFLMKCDKPHRDFYLSLMNKSWILTFPVLDVQEHLDIDSISKEQVYGEIEYLRTGFSGLTYPASARVVPKVAMEPFFLIREASYSSLLRRGPAGLERIDKPSWVDTEIDLSTTPRFVLAGFMSKNQLFPVDYFNSWEDALEHLKGNSSVTYEERIQSLNDYLSRSMLVNTSGAASYVFNSSESLEEALSPLLKGFSSGDILITDASTSKSGDAYRVEFNLAKGIIEDIWADEGYAKGFLVWFNGSLINCTYRFVGKEQALLAAKDAIKGRVLNFHTVKLNNTVCYIGSGVLWQQRRWRHKKLRGSDTWIEKCILCGDTRIKHSNNGMCVSCESNLSYYLKKAGPDAWISPSRQMNNKRKANLWNPSLLNLAKYVHKGLLLEADAEGKWRFKIQTGEINE